MIKSQYICTIVLIRTVRITTHSCKYSRHETHAGNWIRYPDDEFQSYIPCSDELAGCAF